MVESGLGAFVVVNFVGGKVGLKGRWPCRRTRCRRLVGRLVGRAVK